MHAAPYALAASLVASSAYAVAFDSSKGLVKRAGALTSPGAAGFGYPPIRGWSSALQNTAPCGGYDVGGRTDFPMTGGDISILLQRDVYDMKIGIAASSNPTSNSDFVNLFPNVTQQFIGSACYEAPDLSSYGIAEGNEFSLQITFQAGGQNLSFFECADLTAVSASNFKASEEYTCANVTTSTQTIPNQSANAAASSAAATAAAGATQTVTYTGTTGSDKDAVTPLQAGWIGACGTLAVVAAVLSVLAFSGYARFGSRSKVAQYGAAAPAYLDNRSSMSEGGSMRKH
ncbi:hypothetical protein JCM8547_004284 [Rhodosporidiobolus lusitaniae]